MTPPTPDSSTADPESATKEKAAQESASFAETALRLGGKSDEEARRTGAIDKADEQVESLFAARFQTTSSPVHRSVWDRGVPIELFVSQPPSRVDESLRDSDVASRRDAATWDVVMQNSLEVVRRHRQAKTLVDANNKLSQTLLDDL